MYLLRLDDAAPYWDEKKWGRMYNICKEYGIKPIIAIIPHCEDIKLQKYTYDEDFLETIKKYTDEGWTPALHGYNHVMSSFSGGINPVNNRSEFAGVSLDEQRKKIELGYKILESWGIFPKVFVAPAHTFDENTLVALREKTNIRIISDTIANDIYSRDEFFFIPQQTGQVREIQTKITTFCYHPNTTSEDEFVKLEKFLKKHSSKFVSFDDIELKSRKKSVYDELLSKIYFIRKNLMRILNK